jgi:autophagy-related protein 17
MYRAPPYTPHHLQQTTSPGQTFSTGIASMSPPPPPLRSDSPRIDNHHSPNPVETHVPPADLTTWFLNAKRSLSSITLCSRAHLLVDSARAALQEASVISSRCVFLRASLQDQLTIAGQINRIMHTTQKAAREEFEVCMM